MGILLWFDLSSTWFFGAASRVLDDESRLRWDSFHPEDKRFYKRKRSRLVSDQHRDADTTDLSSTNSSSLIDRKSEATRKNRAEISSVST